jgi:hypothetical protein
MSDLSFHAMAGEDPPPIRVGVAAEREINKIPAGRP